MFFITIILIGFELLLKKLVKKAQPSNKFEEVHFKLEKNKNEEKIKEENLVSFKELFSGFDQLTINEYSPGEGIPPHVDSHSPFEDVFCSLSLGSGVVMTVTSPEDESKHFYLKPRSILFISGEARFSHPHSIAQRKLDRVEDRLIFRSRRISMTFRKIRKGECKCPYVKYCDSQKANLHKYHQWMSLKLN
jgi:alkylated DNA repair dioxygenase AlkB